MDISTKNAEGLLALQLGDYESAEQIFKECAQEDRHSPHLQYNLALALYKQGKRDLARVRFNITVNCENSFADAWGMIGVIANEERKYAEASYAWLQAEKFEKSQNKKTEYRALRGRNELIQGNITDGYELLETAIVEGNQLRQWTKDTEIAGKKLLILGDQGFGDQIFYARWLPWVKSLGAEIYLALAKPLHRLFESMCVDKAISDDAEKFLGACHYQIRMSELPTIFCPRIGTLPTAPYLRPVKKWPKSNKIGLAWSGNPLHVNDKNRSIPLSLLSPLLDIEAFHYIQLQHDVRDSDTWALKDSVIEKINYQDFRSLSAMIETLDLVITCDTAVANLAGAMGARVWVLVPYAADWRWMADGESTLWYPSAKVYRQEEDRCWEPVIQRVKQDLLELKNERY
jgi:tetratricopeptide (TPR) repeat protein